MPQGGGGRDHRLAQILERPGRVWVPRHSLAGGAADPQTWGHGSGCALPISDVVWWS